MRITSKIFVFQIGCKELDWLTPEDISKNVENLIDTTVKTQKINPWNIIITGMMYKQQDPKVVKTNKLIENICVRKGCKWIQPIMGANLFRDNVHLNDTGLQAWCGQVDMAVAPLLGWTGCLTN